MKNTSMRSFIPVWLFSNTSCYKIQYFFLFILSALGDVVAFKAPEWRAVGISSYDQSGAASDAYSKVHAIANGGDDNLYIAGEFTGNVRFGHVMLKAKHGYNNQFVAKWNVRRHCFVWALPLHPSINEAPLSLAVQGKHIYIVGTCETDTAFFGNYRSNDYNRRKSNGHWRRHSDIYVLKVKDSGNGAQVVWVKRAGGAGNERATAVSVQGRNVYIAGEFDQDTAAFDDVILSYRKKDLGTRGFVTKLEDSGHKAHFVWAQSVGTSDRVSITSLTSSGKGVYVAGYTTSGFGGIESSGPSQGFVVKLTDEGNTGSVQWNQKIDGYFGNFATSVIDIVAIGTNVYLVGNFSNTVVLGAIELESENDNGYNLFVAKLKDADTTSVFKWAKQAGNKGNDHAMGLAVNGKHVYVTGYFDGKDALFGDLRVNNDGYLSPGYASPNVIYVARLTDTEKDIRFDWVQKASGSIDARAYAVSVHDNNIYVSGCIAGQANFGPINIDNATSAYTSFVAHLVDSVH